LKYDRVTGDILDRELLHREMERCDWCFHLAADSRLWRRNYRPMYATNVEGTRHVLEAAGRAGCRKIVFTSTAGCIGAAKKARDGTIKPADEQERATEAEMVCDYFRSKFQAEALAAELYRKAGLPIVIVNPTAVIGPGDMKLSPTGRFIVDYLNGRLPAWVEARVSWVHVRDVAIGHILAAENGRLGERYILGHAQGNWTMRQTLATLQKVSGIHAPRLRLPRWLVLRLAEMNEMAAFVTGLAPRAPVAGAKMARHKMWFNPAHAINILGLPQTRPEQAFAEAVAWFRANGYVRR
jgi:dihydroflavonol-4-reductase